MNRVLAFLILAAPLAAFGADANPDASFYKHAAEGGLFEVDAGNLAQQKSSNQAVKDFGAMMITVRPTKSFNPLRRRKTSRCRPAPA
jgi:predicted outer membrane protein